MKKRYVIVGTGMRSFSMFVKNIESTLSDKAEITGVYDTNKVRSLYFKNYIGESCTQYFDFDEMLRTEKPDAVIVTTPDNSHHEYIVRSLDMGYDVISEKPVTNTYERCLAIREAEKRTSHKTTVTFNCRFMPYFKKMKEIMLSGKLGKPLAVNYEYRLGRAHGGDYFKRWHRLMEYSESLLLHKSTHHFDIINWLIEDEPRYVTALANQIYYSNGEKKLGERCKTCERRSECESSELQLDYLNNDLYYKAEHEDGYIRDRCAFMGDSDIYDNMSVAVSYSKGTILTYTLNMFSAKEGFNLIITGEKGTLLITSNPLESEAKKTELMFIENGGKIEKIEFDSASGAHSGGDERLIKMIFGNETDDPLSQTAGSFDGFSSAMIGIGANISIKERRTVDLKEYLDALR